MSTEHLLVAKNISSPKIMHGQHKFYIARWAENKDLRCRDCIIPNRRIFPREFPWNGFKQAGSDRSKLRIYIRIPGWNLAGLPQRTPSLFARKIKITPRFRDAAPTNATERVARSQHLAWIKNAHRTRFHLKFASYAYIECPRRKNATSN